MLACGNLLKHYEASPFGDNKNNLACKSSSKVTKDTIIRKNVYMMIRIDSTIEFNEF